MREELQHLGRDLAAELLGLRLQDAEAKLVGRRMDVRHQSPTEPRAHALLKALEVGGRLVGRDDDLPV